MSYRRLLKVAGIVAMAVMIAIIPFLVTACPSDDDDDNGNGNGDEIKAPLKVGVMVPETGVAASKGRPMAAGVRDAIEYINEELDGVLGHQIDVLVRDNQYDASKTTTIIEEFITAEVLLFTTQSSAQMTAAMTRANEVGLPGFAVFSTPKLTQPAQHIYAQLPDYGDDWAAFAQYYMDNIWQGEGKPKMALHLLNNSTGQGARDAAELLADSLGIDLVLVEEHTSTTINEIESLTRIRALNVDVLYISSTPAPTATIIGDAVDLGMYPGVTIGCGHASFTSEMVELAGADADGVYGVFPTVGWGDDVPGMAKMTEYLLANHPEQAGNMDYITAWNEGLIIAEILKQAIQNAPGGADSLTPQLVEQYGFQMLNGYDVGELQGPVAYTTGDNRLSTAVKLYQVVDGVITVIGDWIDAPFIDYGFE